MNCAPFALTSVTSSWKPFCLRSIGRTSFSKRLLSSVSLPLLIWKWTLRANCMMLLPEPLSRWSESPKRRAGVDKVPKPAWTFEGVRNYSMTPITPPHFPHWAKSRLKRKPEIADSAISKDVCPHLTHVDAAILLSSDSQTRDAFRRKPAARFGDSLELGPPEGTERPRLSPGPD